MSVFVWHFVASESDDDERAVTDAVNTSPDTVKTVEYLPNELLLNIFSRLSVQDVCRCAQVCRLWNHLTKQKVLWTDLLPTQWAQGEASTTSPYSVLSRTLKPTVDN